MMPYSPIPLQGALERNGSEHPRRSGARGVGPGPTAYCVDVDPHAPCMYEWLSKPFGGTVCTYHAWGSTTLKSAVGVGVRVHTYPVLCTTGGLRSVAEQHTATSRHARYASHPRTTRMLGAWW